MKQYLILSLLCCLAFISYSQSDSLRIPIPDNLVKRYHPKIKSYTASYNYSNRWDFDGDGVPDSLFLIGNGAAHVYYFPQLILSESGKMHNFFTVQIDRAEIIYDPEFIVGVDQVAVGNFDGDKEMELYLVFANRHSTVPKKWKRQGVRGKSVLLNVKRGKIIATDY